MKRLFLIITMALCAATAALRAQDGLAVARLFEGDYKKRENVDVMKVSGNVLLGELYKLSLFRSISVADDPELAREMESLVEADAAHATDKEVGLRGGRMYYGFFRFAPVDGKNSYVFYRNNLLREGAKPVTTIIYLEGKATMDEIKEYFMRK